MFSIPGPHIRLTLRALAVSAGAVALTGALQASADDLGAFACIDRSGGVAGAAGTISAIRIAHHDGYDRLVIGFATSNTMPQYQLTQRATSDFVRDASGQPVTLQGSAGIRAVLWNTDIATGVPADSTPGLPAIREVTQIGDFERVTSYGVGLATPACFRVLELSGPTRLVIDVATPASAATAAPSLSGTSPAPNSSTAPSQTATPLDLAATGLQGQPASSGNLPVAALLAGLLAIATGSAVLLARWRWLRR